LEQLDLIWNASTVAYFGTDGHFPILNEATVRMMADRFPALRTLRIFGLMLPVDAIGAFSQLTHLTLPLPQLSHPYAGPHSLEARLQRTQLEVNSILAVALELHQLTSLHIGFTLDPASTQTTIAADVPVRVCAIDAILALTLSSSTLRRISFDWPTGICGLQEQPRTDRAEWIEFLMRLHRLWQQMKPSHECRWMSHTLTDAPIPIRARLVQ
jgi:hypothetical protein